MQRLQNRQCILRICRAPFRFFMINNNTLLHVFIFIFVLCHKLFHITGGYIIWCTWELIRWVSEMFALFIHTSITILGFLFLFRCAQSILLTNYRMYLKFHWFVCFIVTRTHCVDAFQFLPIRWSNTGLNVLLMCSIVLLLSDWTLLVRSQTCSFLLFWSEIGLIRKK